MPRSLESCVGFALHLVLLGALASCAAWRPWTSVEPPWTAATFARAEAARMQLQDGSMVELANPRWVERPTGPVVAGRATGPASVPTAELTEREVELAGVGSVEVRKLDGDRVAGNVLAGAALVVAVLMVAALMLVAVNGIPVAG